MRGVLLGRFALPMVLLVIVAVVRAGFWWNDLAVEYVAEPLVFLVGGGCR